MNTQSVIQPPAAGEAAHTLLPIYKGTNGSRYHIEQRVVTGEGIAIWREIATFNDSARRDEVLCACNSHATLVSALEAIAFSLEQAQKYFPGKVAESGAVCSAITQARAVLAAAKTTLNP